MTQKKAESVAIPTIKPIVKDVYREVYHARPYPANKDGTAMPQSTFISDSSKQTKIVGSDGVEEIHFGDLKNPVIESHTYKVTSPISKIQVR